MRLPPSLGKDIGSILADTIVNRMKEEARDAVTPLKERIIRLETQVEILIKKENK